ncbi:hypothetical protein A2483_02105 [Candidatus Peregrinibacteria bacterium RIFOXYC2_FULL_33_13]|nr:MAG: hypothetical protein UR27_C0007G0088 [Candidatus Peregrinibacteria bacterium GW2011_GWA2_33_10]KKP40851.1 MAG: hypothetical protein UR30_C0003G0023 [Candidatus Peregrinibacteria bacterium GW2011_GWC2_33_13]OGJ46907.1 MAG: hypothetical protein A2229_02825 [Candidatus Peregrinibacteria bacterium RIFOXYA2_FULL_33_7]OGJ51912.1 MAG: hypothetical protein A2483_02105 [Candidatus Peregrinibacteria bacterium RIFOXYC2_FULL_33_13]
MSKIIPIKEFRKNLSHYTDFVQQGNTLIVIRRSKPAFKIIPLTEDEKEGKWKTLIDFTEDYPDGIPAEILLKKIEKFEKKHG